MANSSMVFIAIIAIVVIVAIVGIAASLHGGSSSSTTTAGKVASGQGQGSGQNTTSTGSGTTNASGTAGGITWFASAESSRTGTTGLKANGSNAYVLCLSSNWNSSSSGSGVGGPIGGTGTGISPYCTGQPGAGNSSAALMAVYNATNYTTPNLPFPFTTPFTFNYTVGSYNSSLTVISLACSDGPCSLNLPQGCHVAVNSDNYGTSATVAVCPNQGPNTYYGSVVPTNASSSNMDLVINVFYK